MRLLERLKLRAALELVITVCDSFVRCDQLLAHAHRDLSSACMRKGYGSWFVCATSITATLFVYS